MCQLPVPRILISLRVEVAHWESLDIRGDDRNVDLYEVHGGVGSARQRLHGGQGLLPERRAVSRDKDRLIHR